MNKIQIGELYKTALPWAVSSRNDSRNDVLIDVDNIVLVLDIIENIDKHGACQVKFLYDEKIFTRVIFKSVLNEGLTLIPTKINKK